MASNLRVDSIVPSTSGNVSIGTATGGVTIPGDLGIAGVLTYEDVTNIDSVGLITARSGIRIAAGSTVGPVSGIITYFGDGSQLTGISVDSTKIETGNTKVETIDTGSDGHVKITTEGTERLRISSEGYVTKPNLPYFYATATPSITSNYIHSFGNVLGNNGSHYNNSLGRFVAPVTGFYWFACGIWCNSSSTNSAVFIQLTRNINSSGSNVAFAGCNHRTQYNTLNCSGGTYMVASDYVWIKQTGVTIETSTPRNYFSGYLVG